MECSLPGSSVHGILQARMLEWQPFSSPGDLPDPGIKPVSPVISALQADSLPLSYLGNPKTPLSLAFQDSVLVVFLLILSLLLLCLFFFFPRFFFMWTIFKFFIEFVTILLLFYILVFWPPGMWDLSFTTGSRTSIPCIGRQTLNTGLPGKSVLCVF